MASRTARHPIQYTASPVLTPLDTEAVGRIQSLLAQLQAEAVATAPEVFAEELAACFQGPIVTDAPSGDSDIVRQIDTAHSMAEIERVIARAGERMLTRWQPMIDAYLAELRRVPRLPVASVSVLLTPRLLSPGPRPAAWIRPVREYPAITNLYSGGVPS